MKTKTKNRLFALAWELNIFCVGVAFLVVGSHWTNEFFDIKAPEIAYLIQVILPALFEGLSEGNPITPIDFVNYLKSKIWLFNY